jgi:hypothetical protein
MRSGGYSVVGTDNAKSDDLANQQLTVKTYPAFYRRVMRLRFPLDVAEIIELRDIIRHAADDLVEPSRLSRHQRFVEAARVEIEALGVRVPHHAERLVHILLMLRHLYYVHGARSREVEHSLQRRQAAHREAKKTSVKYGVFALAATAAAALTWAGIGDVSWPVKAITILLGYMALDCFYSLSTLSQYHKRLTRELEVVRNERVSSFEWRPLVHRIALILGYLRSGAVKPFVLSVEDEPAREGSLRLQPAVEMLQPLGPLGRADEARSWGKRRMAAAKRRSSMSIYGAVAVRASGRSN